MSSNRNKTATLFWLILCAGLAFVLIDFLHILPTSVRMELDTTNPAQFFEQNKKPSPNVEWFRNQLPRSSDLPLGTHTSFGMYPHSRSSVVTYSSRSERQVLYWCPRKLLDTWGDNILHYWSARSVAFWLDMDFVQLHSNRSKQKNLEVFERMNTSQSVQDVLVKNLLSACTDWDEVSSNMDGFLPRWSNMTSTAWIANLSAGQSPTEITTLIYQLRLQQQFLFHSVTKHSPTKNASVFDWTSASPHENPTSILYLHEIFRHVVVAAEMKRAFHLGEKQRTNVETLETIESQMTSNDVVVEYRCGDIIAKDHELTGFLTIEFYRNVLHEMLETYGVAKSQMKTAYFLIHNDPSNKCTEFMDGIEKPFRTLFEYEFGYEFKPVTNGFMREYMYRIAIAPFVICSVSPNCIAASLGSVKAKAIFYPTGNLVKNYWEMVSVGNGSGNIVHVPTDLTTYIPCSQVNNLKLNPQDLARVVGEIPNKKREMNLNTGVCDLTKFKFYLMPSMYPNPRRQPWNEFPAELAALPQHTTNASEANVIISTEHFTETDARKQSWVDFFKTVHSNHRLLIRSGKMRADSWLAFWPWWFVSIWAKHPMAKAFNLENVSLIHHWHYRSNQTINAFRPNYDIAWPRKPFEKFMHSPNYYQCKQYNLTLYFLGSLTNNYTKFHERAMWDYHDKSVPALERRISSVREAISKGLAGNQKALEKGIVINGVVERHTPGVNQNGYKTGISSSHFCLVPAGDDSDSYRFYESLAVGCIPVVVAGGWVLPFEEILPWEEVVIRIEEDFDWSDVDGLMDRLYKNNLFENVYDRDLCRWHKAVFRMFELMNSKNWHRYLIRNLGGKALEKQTGCKSPRKVELYE